ncbi:extracellular solute-binding protein [Neotabrizicola shimadae]|uniref:Putrescine-binding periplasmic protein n=1 Tax=Neotabrizicola shimadae TaxID=2807096 RepID=A0A8G1EBP1_9RHOB|nr:extracellular solute-binding protein [Neotabrizicola shimadae]QYZ69612.1 extracellular solute-binding protein [Neotabrizicola shimadae]
MKLPTALLLAAALACHVLPASAQDDTLRIYAWAGLFDDVILNSFTDKTGYKVTYDNYDSDETLETKLLSGDTGYDFIVPSATPFLQREIAAGAIEKLDKSLIPNYALQSPELLELLKRADPKLEYAAIGGWGTNGLGYNVDKVKALFPDAPVDSFDLVFKPENAAKLASCGIAVVDSATDVIPLVLNYLGLDPQTQSADDLDKAMALLDQIRPYVTLDKGRLITDMATGNICVAIGYSGDILQAKARAIEAGNGQKIEYVLPKEGTMAWITTLAIPKNAPNPKAAHAFIDHLLSPEISAHLTVTLGYANGVPASRDLLPPEIAGDKTIFPEGEVLASLFVTGTVEDTLNRQRNRAWTRFRSGE